MTELLAIYGITQRYLLPDTGRANTPRLNPRQ